MASKAAQLAAADNLLLTSMMYRNKLINGNFDFWQRGISQSAAGYGSADRWNLTLNSATATVERGEFAPGQTEVPGNPRYFYSATIDGGSTSSSNVSIYQPIEGGHTLSGTTARLTFWARADAAKPISVDFWQRHSFGGTIPRFGATKLSLTTAWEKYSIVVDVPSVSSVADTIYDGSLHVQFYFSAGSGLDDRTVSLGNQSGVFDIAQVQLAEGETDTPFEQRPLAAELLLCQRYCETTYNADVVPGTLSLSGVLTQRQTVAAGAVDSFQWTFSVAKANPIFAVTKYNPAAANSVVRNYSTGTNCTDASSGVEGGLYGTHRVHIPFTTAAGSAPGNLNIVHALISAEIS